MRNENKRRMIFNEYRSRCDVLLLQETHSTPEVEKQWKNEWGGKMYFNHGDNKSRGVAISFCPKFDFEVVLIDDHSNCEELSGRYIQTSIKVDNSAFSICNIYAPNKDTPKFYQDIELKMHGLEANMIIMGDYNLAIQPEIDREGTELNDNKSRDVLLEIMEEYLLVDIWRVRNNDKKEYSWIKSTDNKDFKASHIDMAMVTP